MLLDADMETVDQAKARLQYACYDVERVSTLDGRLEGTRDDHQLNVGPHGTPIGAAARHEPADAQASGE